MNKQATAVRQEDERRERGRFLGRVMGTRYEKKGSEIGEWTERAASIDRGPTVPFYLRRAKVSRF